MEQTKIAKKIFLLGLLVLGGIAGVFLVQKTQELRRGAAYAQAKVWWLPDEMGNKVKGDSFPVYLMADWGNESMIGFNIKIGYSKDKLVLKSKEDVEINERYVLSGGEYLLREVKQEEGAVYVSGVTLGSGVTGMMDITKPWVKLNFEILDDTEEGDIWVSLVTDVADYGSFEVVGDKAEGDALIELRERDGSLPGAEGIRVVYSLGGEDPTDDPDPTSVPTDVPDPTDDPDPTNAPTDNPDPTSVPTDNPDPTDIPTDVPTGEWPILNFLIRFSGITQDTEYNQSSVVNVTVVSANGSQEVYREVGVSREEGRDPGIYRGSLELVGFEKGMQNSVFIDGPKHLQAKFCGANQSKVCTSYVGNVVLMEKGDKAPVYDFSGWMIMAGDIPDGDGVRDGVVDVADYTRLVNSWGTNKEECDLNGNGKVDALDLGALLDTLSKKYGEIY